MRAAAGVKRDADLARFLGLERDRVAKWGARDSKPWAECLQLAQQTGVSLDWLMTGEGDMRRGAPADDAPAGAVVIPPELAHAVRRVRALVEMLAQMDGQDLEAVLSDCFARAQAAQQIAELRQAVSELTAAYSVCGPAGKE